MSIEIGRLMKTTLMLAPMAILAVSLPASAKAPGVWNVHCWSEISVNAGGGRYVNTTYLTQRQTISLSDDFKDGISPALNRYAPEASKKWESWKQAQPGPDPKVGDCYFDGPGSPDSYATRKKRIEESLTWGPDRYLKIIQFDFPPAN